MKNLTQKRLENIALYYLERYDANCSKLRSMLKRRVLKYQSLGYEVPVDIDDWIQSVVEHMASLGYVNDQRFCENMVRRLSQSGKSKRFIQAKLLSVGMTENAIRPFLSDIDDTELARIFYRKKKLGQDPEKALAKMARAGFSYETVRSIIGENQDV